MTESDYTADVTVIGAGLVGLAIAAELAREGRSVYVLEKNDGFGRETSSHNSQVIHAGIYYPPGSFKAKLCVEGNALLYDLCHRWGIGHNRLGKLIVAADDDEAGQLEGLMARAIASGARDLSLLSRRELRRMEPNVAGVAALFSPWTGIVDAYHLMRCFAGRARENGARLVYRSEVVGIQRRDNGYRVEVRDASGVFSFHTVVLVNSAGLQADRVAGIAGIDPDSAGYRLSYCKGQYFSAGGNGLVRRLVYPAPESKGAGLGVHVTLDLEGRMLLGPDAHYVTEIDYSVDDGQRQAFCESAMRLLPEIDCSQIQPEMAGIRPKLQGPGEEFRDFIIRDEADRGLPGFIDLIGIESPGLTASPAMARLVGSLAIRAL